MKIGIDAKWYLSGNPSGKVVVQNIVNEIIKLETEHEFVLFIQRKDRNRAHELEEKCSHKKNIRIIYCISCINFLSNLFIIPFYAKKYKVEVFLYQNYTPFIFCKSIKNVAYIHDFLFFDYPQYFSVFERIVFRLMKVTSRFARVLITISNSEKKRIAKYTGFPNEKVFVVYHGISNDFACRENIINTTKLKDSLPSKYILFVGRINVRKNIEILLDSMKSIDQSLNLVIIGKKDHKTFDIEKKIIDLNLNSRVTLVGHVEYCDLINILSHAFLFVFPSFAEGFGLPPLEAMKSGIPVVVSNATCLPEVCGDSALYFSPFNKEDLIFQINSICLDPSLYEKMKRKGLLHVEKFQWNLSVEEILRIITNENL